MNPQPTAYKAVALPIELRRRVAAPTYSRCRLWTSAYKATAAALDTLRLSTELPIGMCVSVSHVSRVRRRRPLPSAPSTRAVRPLLAASTRGVAAALSRPRHQNPARLSWHKARARFGTRTKGTCSNAPEAALARAPVTGGVYLSCAIRAAAPKAAQARITAP